MSYFESLFSREAAVGVPAMAAIALFWIAAFVLGSLAALMPFFIYKINQRIKILTAQIETLQSIQTNSKLTMQNSAAATKLLRQLIKAYGHDPEA